MAFKLTKSDLKKSATCPPGMHDFTAVKVYDQYVKDNGVSVQQVDFETNNGYVVSVYFNSKVMSNLFEFVAAADKVAFDLDKFEDTEIDLKDYQGKKVCGSVSHRKEDGGNRIFAQIDNFYAEGKVPF